MDGDWGNILYFVLMVLFVIFGALKKKKPVSKPQVNTDTYSEDEELTDVEKIFDSLLGRNPFEAQQEHPYNATEDEFVDEETIDLPKEKPKEEIVKSNSPLTMEVEYIDEDEFEESDEFNWKQAIISKEILDRKYI